MKEEILKPTLVTSLSVVVPVYNSEPLLPILCKRLARELPRVTDKYEIILVNDGSTDRSWEVIQQIVAEQRFLRCINLMRNYGQHNALLAGIREAQYDYIVTMDDDLQHPCEEIHFLLTKLIEGYDVVYGTAAIKKHSFWRRLASQFTRLTLKAAMGVPSARKVSAFRAFRAHLRDAFIDYESHFVSIDVLLSWGTTRFGATPVRHQPRQAGVSNYTFRRLIIHALNVMTGFTTMPLRLASLVGFIFALFGFSILCYVVGRYVIEGGSVPGFPFLASMIAIFSGVQLFALGVIGEYLSRMHFRIMRRPAYHIREKIESDKTLDN